MLYTLAYTVLVKGWSHLAGKMKCQNLIATVLHTQYSLVTITKKSFDSHENYQPSRTKYRLIYQENTTLVIIKKCIILKTYIFSGNHE